MKLFNNQLIVLEKGYPRGKGIHWVILAWHWKLSITWSWLIWWWSPFSNHSKIYPGKWYNKFLGNWYFAKQKPLYYKVSE